MKLQLEQWLQTVAERPGGDILAVQTLRNAIMVASVLASASLVAMMGVLATAHLHHRGASMAAAVLLVCSVAFAIHALARLSVAGFDMQFTRSGFETVAHKVQTGLKCSVVAGLLWVCALAVAAVSLVIASRA